MNKSLLLGAFATLLMCFSASSKAVVVHWELVNAVLEDGQTITGGFDYDREQTRIQIFLSPLAVV